MATKTIKPSFVFIGNKNSFSQSFPIYKQNLNYTLNAGDSVYFRCNDANELFYYEQLNVTGLEVGLVDLAHYLQLGSYNLDTSTFTEGNTTYSLIGNGNNYKLIGVIPFEPASSALGLAKGNRITIRTTSNIAYADLPSGIIVKTTNRTKPAGYNEYTKTAFESDGSLVTIMNVSGPTIEIKIKWKVDEDFTTYTIDTSEATYMPEN